jgi:intergrase/recombinase
MQWYSQATKILRSNERLLLRYAFLSGLRRTEALTSFNLIIELSRQNKLSNYYNEELSILEHFRYPQFFIRNTKNVFITVIDKELIRQIAASEPVTYAAIRKRLLKQSFKVRIRELRSFYASFLHKHGILSEEVEILQGRIPKSVFVRHYLKENPKELSNRILSKLADLEQSTNN